MHFHKSKMFVLLYRMTQRHYRAIPLPQLSLALACFKICLTTTDHSQNVTRICHTPTNSRNPFHYLLTGTCLQVINSLTTLDNFLNILLQKVRHLANISLKPV